jgi:hypothetical protein
MNVWRVAQISGPAARWSGESISLKREYASRVQTRRVNRGKTYLLAGAVAVGLYVFTTQIDLFGFASDNGGDGEPLPPISSRGWWP